MATNTTTIKFTGQFDTSQITKGLQDIKKQMSNTHIGQDLQKQLETALNKVEVNIPALEKMSAKGEFNFKELQNYQKILVEVSKDMNNLINLASKADFTKAFSSADTEKLKQFEKQLSDVESKIKSTKKEIIKSFEESEKSNGKGGNRTLNSVIEQLISVPPDQMKDKLDSIIKEAEKQTFNAREELQNIFKDAKYAHSGNEAVEFLFGKNSGVEIADKKKTEIQKAFNGIRKEIQAFNENTPTKDVEETLKKLIELVNSESLLNTEGKESALKNLLPQDVLERLKELANNVPELQKILGKENLKILDEQEAEKIKITSEQVKFLENRLKQLVNAKKITIEQANLITQSLNKQENEVEELSDQYKKQQAQTEALNATFGGLAHRIENSISALAVFNKSMQIIRNAIKSVEDLDAAFTQIAIVSEQSSESAWKMFDSFNKLAKQYSITTKDLAEGAKLFYQQGLNAADTMKMVEASTVSAALGEVTMTEAANTLTAAIQGYNESAAVAMDYTDKIAMVGAVSAADFNELSTAMEKTASSAYTAGIDFDHLLGYLGKMIEVTREAPANLGTAMKTIIARFEDMKKDPLAILEDGVTANKVEAALATIGIALRDTAGEFRPLQEVFDELGMKWQSLTRNQQAYIATVAAGSRQQSRFLAMMNNYDRTLDLISESMNSAGAAAKQYETYQDSIAAAQARLTASWENFYSKIIDNSAIKIAINGLSSLVDVLSKIPPIVTTIGISLGALQIQNLIKNVTNSNTALGSFISNFRLLAQGAKETEISFNELVKLSPRIADVFKNIKIGTENSSSGFAAVTKTIGAFIKANIEVIAIIAAVTATIYIVNKAINANKEAYEKSVEAIKKYNDEANEMSNRSLSGETLMKSYDELSSKISLTEEEQSELNDTINQIKDIYPEAIEYVDEYGNKQLANADAIRDNIELEKQLAKEKQRSALQERENLLNRTSPDQWKPQDFINIGYSNTLIDSYFSNKESIQKLKGLQGQLDNRFWQIYNSIGNSIDMSTGINETARHNAILELNSWADRFGITIERLGEQASKAEIFDFKRKLQEEIENLENSLPEQIEKLNQLQNDMVDSLHRKNILDISFLDIKYDETSKEVSTAQKIIAAQIESMFGKMDLNIWNEFLNTNNIDIKHPEQLTEKIQEILNEVTEDNAIELQQLFKDLNSGEITAAKFYEDFEKIALESGSESALNFIEAFDKQLNKQLEKEKEKYKEFLNSLGLTQDQIEKSIVGYQLGTGNRRQSDIQNYYMESNGPMQDKINKYLSISDKTLDEMTEKVQKAIEEGDVLALQNLPEIMVKDFEDFDEEAGMILLNGKIREAINQLSTLSLEEADKIADNLFTKKDYSKVKASEAYQYKEIFSNEDEFYSSLNYKDGSLQFSEGAQLKLATAERKKDIELLENEILKEQVMIDILNEQKEDTGDVNGELENQIKKLQEQIKYYERLLDKANKMPVLLKDSLDITEDLLTAAKQYNTTLDNINHNKSNDARTLKTSAEIGEEYEKIVKITKTLDEQMKSIGHVSQETMTSMLEMGSGFADFFTIKDDQTIIYGLEKVKGDYQSASEAIISIAKKRREAELELQRQQIDDEIVLVQAKIDGYNKIADALEEYAEFQRNSAENTTQKQKELAKENVENQINAAEKSIENAENTWNSQVAAAKMAYDQMSELDITFWEHLGEKEIKKYVSDIYGTFKEIKAPEHGVIDLSSLIEKGDPQELEDAAGKYRNAAQGLQAYIDSLQKAKDNLKAIDPTIYDDMEEKLKNTGQAGKDAFDKIAKAIEDADKALQDLDDLLIEIKRDLNDITVEYNPFTDLFEAWEHEWDYYYNIKRLIAQIGTQGEFIDNIISSDYTSADQKLEAEHAKVGSLISKMAANDAYITALRAGMSQTGVELMKDFGEYYKIDPSTGQIYQTDKNLTQINDTVNQRRQEIYDLQKLQNEKENDLALENAKLDALEEEKSAYEDILSTIDSQIDSLENNKDIIVNIDDLKNQKAELEAKINVTDESIESVKEKIRGMEDEIQEIDVKITLKDQEASQLENYVDRMEDKVSEYEEYWETLNATIAEQQEILQQLTEERNNYIETAISTQRQLYNAIVENYQDEINEKKKQYDYLKQLDQDYLRSIRDNISKERQIREDASKQRSYQQNQQRAQLLQMDTSGAFRSELASLNKEIEGQRQELYDDLVDKQVEALEKEIDKRHELYDKEVSALEERLAYMQENAVLLWESVNAIVAEGTDAMMAMLENTTEYINSNELERMNLRYDWEYNVKKTFEGTEEGVIAALNGLVAAGNEFIIDKYPEVGQAIDNYKLVFDDAKIAVENYTSGIKTGTYTMLLVFNDFMTKWNTATNNFTGYADNWSEIITNLIEQTEEHKAELEGYYDEEGIALSDLIGSIGDFDDKIQETSQQLYDDFIEERRKYRQELDDVVRQIQAEISAAITNAANAIQNAANSISFSAPQSGGGTSGGDGGSSYTPTIPSKSGVEPESKKYSANVVGTLTDNVTGKSKTLEKDFSNLNSQMEIVRAANSWINEEIQKFSNELADIYERPPYHNKRPSIQRGLKYNYYKQGGFADFTGPAWLDGTKSKPEAVLNAKQTRLFTSMVSSLEKASNNSNINSALGSSYNIGDINTNINVEKLDNETDIDRVARQVENRIMKSIRNRVSIAVA